MFFNGNLAVQHAYYFLLFTYLSIGSIIYEFIFNDHK